MGFDLFNITGALFPIAFIAFVAIIIVVVMVRGIKQWSHNNAQCRIPAEAVVVSKRENISHHHHTGTAESPQMHMTTSTSYYVTFEFASGDRQEFCVPSREYGLIAEGDSGTLTSQGTRFISFARHI